MNSKYLAATAIFATILFVAGFAVVVSDDSDAAESFTLTNETITLGDSYSKIISGQGMLEKSYYTLSGASWLSLSDSSSAYLTASGTPTVAGTYNVTVTGPFLQGNLTGVWTWTVTVVNSTTYTVNIYDRLSTLSSSATLSPGSTYTLPTQSDDYSYSFLGYYTAASGGSYVGTSGTKITVNSDRNIYTHWSVRTYYDVTLDFNGYYYHPDGTSQYTDYIKSTVESGNSYSFSSADSALNSGYVYDNDTNELVNPTLLGWSKTPSGSAVSYSTFTVTSTITYYAVWGEIKELSFLDGTNNVIGVSGGTYSYTPGTNITSAVLTYTKTVDWLTFSNGTLSGTFPTVASPTTYTVVLTATSSSPTQTVTQSITFYVYPEITYIEEPITSIFMGESYDYELSSSLDGVVYTVSGVEWLTISDGHIVGCAPVADDSYIVTFKITATHAASGQTNTRTVDLTVNEILEFTTLPTSSFVASQVEGSVQYGSFILDYLDGLFSSSSASGEIDYFFTGSTVKFVFTGDSAEDLNWYVDGKLVSNDWTLTYTFTNGAHVVSCIANNDLGSSEEFSVTISVDQGFCGLTVIDYMIILIIVLLIVLVAVRIWKARGPRKGRF